MSEPGYDVQHVRNVLIPMRDGVELAASLFMPVDGYGSSDGPFPAILEYLPYRKDDNTAGRWNTHYHFARRGYVGVRLDVRGTGGSRGIARDEYTVQEQLDGYDAIEWLAAQPWSNGRVGMWGTSYGGFNCIQVAMHRPPHLAAIVPHAATDDRYNDDVHYSGGCLSGLEKFEYPLMMVAMNALPPYREISGDDWEAIWTEHLENPPWMIEWIRRQREDEFWLNGSLKTDYSAIACPVLMIGGWNDGYTNAVFRMLEQLDVPARAIVGPWTHMRPDVGYAGPRIDYLAEVERWWGRWLKEIDTGVQDEPPLSIYVQRWYPPERFPETIPGEWRYEPAWPPERLVERTLYLHPDESVSDSPPGTAGKLEHRYDPTIGVSSPNWCPTSPPNGIAADTRSDDARSLTFELSITNEPVELLGQPRAVLHVASTAPVAFFTVKLVDVAPDGRSTFVTRGTLNATRRNGMDAPEPLAPGTVYELEIPLKAVSWVLEPGHRLRVSIASADWPTIWPSPYPATNSLFLGPEHPSRIILPTVPAGRYPVSEAPSYSPPPEMPATTDGVGSPEISWRTARDEVTGAVEVHLSSRSAHAPHGLGATISRDSAVTASVHPDDPGGALMVGSYGFGIRSDEHVVQSNAEATIQATPEQFQVTIRLEVDRDGARIAERTWTASIPRDLL